MTATVGRYDRQIRLFAAEGHWRIADTTVLLVGLGGLGSHVAQQLAYLGVLRFVLVDDDVVSLSNLNRLIGATPRDIGRLKIEVVRDLIIAILPEAEVTLICSRHDADNVRHVAHTADVLIAGVDEEPVRLALLELTTDASTPYIDLATDVVPADDGESVIYGGRLCFSFGPEGGCLSCLDQLDQNALRWARMTPDQRREDEEIYGVSRRFLDGTGPAVVSLNGVVASLGVTEFAVWRAGLRSPARVLTYDARRGGVRMSVDTGDQKCPYCVRASPRAT